MERGYNGSKLVPAVMTAMRAGPRGCRLGKRSDQCVPLFFFLKFSSNPVLHFNYALGVSLTFFSPLTKTIMAEWNLSKFFEGPILQMMLLRHKRLKNSSKFHSNSVLQLDLESRVLGYLHLVR